MAVESSLVNSVGEEYQVWKRGRSYQVCVEEYNVEKSYMGSWEEYEFRYRGSRGHWFWIRKSRSKKWGWEEYQVVGNYIQPWTKVLHKWKGKLSIIRAIK